MSINREAAAIGQTYETALASYNAHWARAVAEDAHRRRQAYEDELDAGFRREAIEAYESANPRPTFAEIAERMLTSPRPHIDVSHCPEPAAREVRIQKLKVEYDAARVAAEANERERLAKLASINAGVTYY